MKRTNMYGTDISHCVDDNGVFIGVRAYEDLQHQKVRESTFWKPITLEKAETILSYFKKKLGQAKAKDGRVTVIDHVMAGIDGIRPNEVDVDKYFIKTQITITTWVVEALRNGVVITDFREFYEDKCAERRADTA